MTQSSNVITRFAPSPTGYLHIGSARTALFNWLFAKHCGGKFLLRIEDTDRQRSTDDAVRVIFEGMKWLGLDFDGDAIYQFERAARHAEVAHAMVESGYAYYCYTTPQELEIMREMARAEHKAPRYNGYWRDRDASEAPAGVQPVVRLKVPLTGETIVHDMVQGEVRVTHDQLDDMVLLRADGTPTYMLSVVVDDHDMNITHVIRGDDHLTNTFRQVQIYNAMGWDLPTFAHIPLIHGPDGAKLSKRHGALGVDAYKDMGILSDAMCNYLLRLGWGHGDDEIIARTQAIEWFTLEAVGRSPSRFDMTKLLHLNGHYIRDESPQSLYDLLLPFIKVPMSDQQRGWLFAGIAGLQSRVKSLPELAEMADIYTADLIPLDDKAKALWDDEAVAITQKFLHGLQSMPDDRWTEAGLDSFARTFADLGGLKLGKLAQPLRIAMCGRTVSPSLFEVMAILGRTVTCDRLQRRLAQPI